MLFAAFKYLLKSPAIYIPTAIAGQKLHNTVHAPSHLTPSAYKTCDTRDMWLGAATSELRIYFDTYGYILPTNMRFAVTVALTPKGKRSRARSECRHPTSSNPFYRIIIRPDVDDPIDVLGLLVHELVHALLPPEAKHGKAFRNIALPIGLEVKRRETVPVPHLRRRLEAIAHIIGAFPLDKLNSSTNLIVARE
jgi:hypothetical protein